MKHRISFYAGSSVVSSEYEDEAVAQIEQRLRDGEDLWLTSGDGQRTFVRFANITVVAMLPIEDIAAKGPENG